MATVIFVVAASFPRVPFTPDSVESGVIWLTLGFASFLLSIAVTCGFAAFASASFALYPVSSVTHIIVPVVVGGFFVLVSNALLGRRLILLYPGDKAVWGGLTTLNGSGKGKLDEEMAIKDMVPLMNDLLKKQNALLERM